MTLSARAGAALIVAFMSLGCGGTSERETRGCRNAWREISIPTEFTDFQAWAAATHNEKLYLFKSEPEGGGDPYPDGPVGLIFEPSNQFRAMSSDGRPPLVWLNASFPVGSEIVLTAGPIYDEVEDGLVFYFGARYDTVSDTWELLPELADNGLNELAVSPMGNEILAVRHEATKVTTILPPEYLAWSRATGWRPLSSPPETGMWVRGAWTGREVILWGDADRYDQFGAPAAVRYDPDADRWQSISEVGAPTLGEETKAVWTGMELVTQEGRYYPDRDAWEPVSDAPVADGSPFAIDRRVLFWSMSLGEAQGAVYDAESDRWGPPITTRCLDQSATGRVTAWIDRGLFVWDSRDRAWLLPSAAALGELPTDPAGCSCPSALGAE